MEVNRLRIAKRCCLISTILFSCSTFAESAQPFTFITNWYAQAEHGGFYQAKAEGLYQQKGLDVTLKMGGPQVNAAQLLVAGQAQCIITDDIGVMMAKKRGLPIKLVATTFQFDPTVVITHPDVKSLADLKGHTVLISASARSGWWPWAKQQYGFTDAMTRPYTFNIQPFILDKSMAQQGFMTSEPFALQQKNVKANVFSLGQEGYPPYGNSIACSDQAIQQHPEQITAFLQASMQGWKSYLTDPSAGNVLIKKANPNMTDAQLDFSVKTLKSSGIVEGGDAAQKGIGVITDARMEKTWKMGVQDKLFTASQVALNQVYTTDFINNVKVLP